MINFVVRDEKRAQTIRKVKSGVVGWTSLILGIYIVAMAGFLGWNVLWSTKEKKASTEEVSLRQQITSLSENQVLAMKLLDRATEINKFLDERGTVSRKAELLPRDGYTIFKWAYGSGGIQEVSVIGENPAQLKGYEDYLRTVYNQVQVEKVIFDPLTGWMEVISVKGAEKI
jgi:hypothetical protein